ncbi:MAG: flagellar hook-length control protein FliK [Thalassobaculum sp.]|uniref:flagellar hook-length control protein FliK n=1 Tax=Thalassobaculum sp. TaxID=2022740 RepID=UPI0032ED1268
MDLNPLDPRAAHTSTGGARRGNAGDSGFRGLMDLMAHLSADAAPRSEEYRRPAEDREHRAEHAQPAAKNSNDDPRPAARPARDRRETEAEEGTGTPPAPAHETRPATASTGPTPGGDSSAAAIELAAASDVDAAPSVPASTPPPSRVGVPATEMPASATAATPADPARAAASGGQPVPQHGNVQAATAQAQAEQAPASQAPASQAAASQAPAAGSPATQATGSQIPGAQASGAQASGAQVSGGTQVSGAQPAAIDGMDLQAPATQQVQVAQAKPGQTAQGQAAQGQGPAQQPAVAAHPTAAAAVEAAPRPTAQGKPTALPGDAKVSVEPGTVVARTQGVSAAVLVQAHMAAVGDANGRSGGLAGQGLGGQGLVGQGLVGQGLVEQSLAGQGLAGQVAAPQSAQPLHVGGGQALFVGADAGDGQAGAQAGGGQNGDGGQAGQNGGQPQNGGQAQAGGGFAFGTATIGQRGFGGDAARAQFQEILSTRTARAPLQGSGATTPGGTTPLAFTAGPGGPQSTLTTAMASRAEATAQGRPGALASTAVGQVAMKLAGTAADGGGRVTIRLNPEELGKVDVKLEFSRDGSVRALISAERPETLDMLQRDARVLDKALQEAGLKTDQNSLQFNLQGGNGQPAGRDDQQTAKLDREPTGGPDNAHDDEVDTASLPDAGGVRADGSYDLVA